MAYGIKIANKAMDSSDGFAYNTQNIHAQVELGRTPPFLGTLDISSLTSFPVGTTNSETILTIEHGLGFVPRVFSYYYMYDAPSDYTSSIGNFYRDFIQLQSSAGLTNMLYTYVDARYMKVIHYWQDRFSLGTGTESQTFKFRGKYMITSLEDSVPVDNPLNPHKTFS